MLPAPQVPDESLLGAGHTIAGRYRVETLLGQGGMAAVYRVFDERTGEKLALKQLRACAPAHAELVTAQFKREYHTLCQLAHPHIVRVLDYAADVDRPFYTMELLDGQDLGARRNVNWREVCALLSDVASALAIIHSRRLVHRDVSLSNVRCTADGRVKLIDFGALTPVGVVKQVIGTPPFIAPEAVQLQALDGRCDLYALGVLAYFMLTGYYPYHARSVGQLKSLWRSPPYPPRSYHEAIPEALDSLVMRLLELDRAARPPNAAEVIERLSGIAGLSLHERPEVRKAYLAMPVLVGRNIPLDVFRAALAQTERGEGGTLLIEAASGMGRSRMLDACVLEAKLQGTLLVRGDAGDSGEDYGLARALCAQLMQQVPELCDQGAQTRRPVLGYLLPELGPERATPVPMPERPALLAALYEFIASIAREKPLVIAIDDLDKLDEASVALLAGLSHRAKALPLCLLLTLESSAPKTSALALIRQAAQSIPLSALNASQTEALLRSVFGDVAHIAALSERIQRVCEGNPRWTMTAAEQLVEHGMARYEAGSWALPAELDPGVLPQYLAGALWRRVAALPADARELAEALSLTDLAVLSLTDYRLLTSHGDAGRVFDALDALVSGGVMVPEGNRYRFAQVSLRELLQRGQDAARARELHARIAAALERSRHPLQLAYHVMLAGREGEALDRLLALPEQPKPLSNPWLEIELVERALATAEALHRPLRQQLRLREWLLRSTAMLGTEQARTQALALIAQYERDCGLWDYRQLQHAGLPHAQRVQRALQLAAERYAATDEQARGLPPEAALASLAAVTSRLVSVAAIAADVTLLDRAPDLLPFCEVAPQLALARLHIEVQRGATSGRFAEVMNGAHEILRRLEQPDGAGLPPSSVRNLRLGMLYVLGLFAAGGGQAEAREYVAELQRAPGHRSNAWRVRMVYELMHGNHEAAAVCRRRAELLSLQDGVHAMFPGTTVMVELHAAIYADDLLALKRLSERIDVLARQYPMWRGIGCLARSHYKRLQGDLAGAWQELAPALAAARPGVHSEWGTLVCTEVVLLSGLGRANEAADAGLRYLALMQREQIWSSFALLFQWTAEAALAAGRIAEASALMTRCLEQQEAYGPFGISLGRAFETRARVAIAERDQAGLQRYFERCAHELKGLRDGTLTRIHERLVEAASEFGLCLNPMPEQKSGNAGTSTPPRAEIFAFESD